MIMLASVILVSGFITYAMAFEDFVGFWSDNIVGVNSIGDLTVKPGMIKFQNFARYSVTKSGAFGKGALFKVTGVDHRQDPMGCGPTSHVTYIVIVPLASVEGTSRRGIDVIFYGGIAAPASLTINDDRAVCGSHPFGRGG